MKPIWRIFIICLLAWNLLLSGFVVQLCRLTDTLCDSVIMQGELLLYLTEPPYLPPIDPGDWTM